MVYLYLCSACERGDHSKCELCHSVIDGQYGGSICRCPCRGDPDYMERAHDSIKLDLKQLAKIKQDRLK